MPGGAPVPGARWRVPITISVIWVVAFTWIVNSQIQSAFPVVGHSNGTVDTVAGQVRPSDRDPAPTSPSSQPASEAAPPNLAASIAEWAPGPQIPDPVTGALDQSTNFSWLADVLNTHNTILDFKRQRGRSQGPMLLQDWIVTKGPAVCDGAPCVDAVRDLDLNCADKRYSGALTGKPATKPRFIVDFVPVGMDLDVVELRLLEEWPAIDVFVLFEAPFTHAGDSKPLYLRESMARTSRWAQFKSKIVHIVATEEMYKSARQKTLETMARGKLGWEIEHQMRHDPIKLIKESDHPLAKRIMEQVRSGRHSSPDALAMQNDGDEISTGRALMHMKKCELKGAPPFYMPAIGFKGGARYFLSTKDMGWLATKWKQTGVAAPADISSYLWKPGPTVNSLQVAFIKDLGQGRYGAGHKWLEFGPGAAVHMSSNSDPVQQWLKAMSVVEAVKILPQELVNNLKNRTVNPAVINANLYDVSSTAENFCRQGPHVSTMSPELQEMAQQALPWPLSHPALTGRYPCITFDTFGTHRTDCGRVCCYPKCY